MVVVGILVGSTFPFVEVLYKSKFMERNRLKKKVTYSSLSESSLEIAITFALLFLVVIGMSVESTLPFVEAAVSSAIRAAKLVVLHIETIMI